MTGQDAFNLSSGAELSRRRGRLLARIHKRYRTVEQEYRIGELRVPFTRVTDPDEVLDMIAGEVDRREQTTGDRKNDEELHLPYWAELWDSSFAAGQWLARQSSSAPMSVLDLGCGMGFAGTVAAMLGHKVVLADLEPDALLFARLNTLPWSSRAITRKLNWQRDTLGERFDLILGADVLYEKAQWDHLEPFWRSHLEKKGVVLLAEPGRQTGDAFVEWIISRGWLMERQEVSVPTRERPIRLFVIRR